MVLKCFVLENVPEKFVLKSNAPNAQRHFVLDYLIRMTHGAMTIIPADFCYKEFPQMMYPFLMLLKQFLLGQIWL